MRKTRIFQTLKNSRGRTEGTVLRIMQESPLSVPSLNKEGEGFEGHARHPLLTRESHLLLLSSSCSVYTTSSAACVLALLSPHLSFRLWGPDAAHSSRGGEGGNGRVFAFMNWLNGPTPISLIAWILILEVWKQKSTGLRSWIFFIQNEDLLGYLRHAPKAKLWQNKSALGNTEGWLHTPSATQKTHALANAP